VKHLIFALKTEGNEVLGDFRHWFANRISDMIDDEN